MTANQVRPRDEVVTANQVRPQDEVVTFRKLLKVLKKIDNNINNIIAYLLLPDELLDLMYSIVLSELATLTGFELCKYSTVLSEGTEL